MLPDLQQYDHLTLIFMIPNVSHLLIYKDNCSKSQVMRKVISEILNIGLFSKLYLGNTPEKYHQNPLECTDCAIVSIKIDGVNLLNYTPKNAAELFASEIAKETNILQYNNTLLNAEDNISTIGVNIRIPDAANKRSAKTAA